MNLTATKLIAAYSILLLILMTGCDGKEEAIPTYLEILPFELTTDYSLEGSASEKIVDGWLYVGGEFLGAYELPATVPVLASGSTEIILFPGIKLNGIASRPEINDFYNSFTTTVDLQEAEITTIQPTTAYRDNVVFPFIENFDGSHQIEDDEDGNQATAISLTTDQAFENASGYIRLTNDNPQMEAATNVRFEDLPLNNNKVYLELDYKTDIPFAIGLIGHQINVPEAKQYIFIFNPKEDWNKIYIDLSSELTASGLSEYQIVLNAILPTNSDESLGNVYLDNMKLIHF